MSSHQPSQTAYASQANPWVIHEVGNTTVSFGQTNQVTLAGGRLADHWHADHAGNGDGLVEPLRRF